MVAPLVAAGIGAGLAALGNVIGGLFGMGKDAEAARMREKAAAEFGEEILPELDAYLRDYGIPESKLAALTGDAESIDAQREALAKYREIINSKGNDAQFGAALQAAGDQAAGQYQSNQAEIQRMIESQGMGGGIGVAALQNANAGAGMLANRGGMQAAGLQSQRELDALRQYMAGSSEMRSQAFREKSTAAEGADRIAMFNSQRRFDADEQRARRIQQYFDNQMSLRKGRSGAYSDQAGGEERSGARGQQFWNNMGGAAGGFAADYFGQKQRAQDADYDAWSSDFNERLKKLKGG